MNYDQVKERGLKLIEFIDAAKDSGRLLLANSAFAELLDDALDYVDGIYKFALETQDELGEFTSQVYYDVLRIEIGEEGACIPVPLLSVYSIVAAMKTAEVVEHRLHDRSGVDEQDRIPEEGLRRMLLEIASSEQLGRAALEHLAEVDGDGCVFGKVVCEYWAANDGAEGELTLAEEVTV